MNLIIAGCRDFTDRDFIYEGIDSFITDHGTPDLIIEGGATGVDRIAGEYARDHNIPLRIFKADWNKYGRVAGPIRNEKMARYVFDRICRYSEHGYLLAFWDGKSRGTKNMIEKAQRYGLTIIMKIFKIDA